MSHVDKSRKPEVFWNLAEPNELDKCEKYFANDRLIVAKICAMKLDWMSATELPRISFSKIMKDSSSSGAWFRCFAYWSNLSHHMKSFLFSWLGNRSQIWSNPEQYRWSTTDLYRSHCESFKTSYKVLTIEPCDTFWHIIQIRCKTVLCVKN